MGEPLLLVIDDDDAISLSLRVFFEKKGYSVITAADGKSGIQAAFKEIPDAVLLDLRLPDAYGIDILREIKKHHPEISVMIMTGYGEVKEAVEAMKLGAEYYFQKPIDLDELSVIVEKGLSLHQMKQGAVFYRDSPYPIIGRSKHTQGLIHMMNLLAENASATVLIQGETGTGKELLSRNIHALSSRRDNPFVDINCAAIPDHIVESELFGYEAGAFTDAKRTKKGLFELADGGTLFLDEIGDMPQNTQAKILRVLEARTLKRLGGTRDIPVDVRIIAATNKNLGELVKKGAFRDDLYYRLNVMPLIVLPLRERPDDVPLIADFLLSEVTKAMGKREITGFTGRALDLLCSYPWPGNVRELRNIIERAAIICRSGSISEEHLMLPHAERNPGDPMTLQEVEEAHIKRVLDLAGGVKTKAARMLGISRSTLNEKLKTYGLS